MFGSYDIPLNIEKEDLTISLQKEGDLLVYKRDCGGEKEEKILFGKHGMVLLNPVEPLNTPKAITPHLIIELERDLMVDPKGDRKVFLTFPVEAAVFIPEGKEFEILDLFTFTKPRYTLYGDPRVGTICKLWKSDVHSSPPSVNPLHEGVMEFNIINKTPRWVEVTRAVFNSYGMKIYYNDKRVAMKGQMEITGKEMAETTFVDSPLEKKMVKSVEVYTIRKLSIGTTTFLMEWGL